jgi:hypothetical protein
MMATYRLLGRKLDWKLRVLGNCRFHQRSKLICLPIVAKAEKYLPWAIPPVGGQFI